MRHLTVHEAAEALQLSVPTIKRYIYDGKLKSTKLPGGQHRIPESEVARLLALHGGGGTENGESAEQRIAVLERWVTEQEAEIERLTAALEVISTFCARRGEPRELGTEPVRPSARRLAVLGPGCRRCNALHDLLATVLQAQGRTDLTIERINNLEAITAFGPVLTPALVIGDTVVLSGHLPSETALRELLDRYLP